MKYTSKDKGSVIVALDIGSSKIACFIGLVTDDQGGIEVVGVGYHAAKGMKNGAIADMVAVEESVRQAAHAAENMASRDLDGYHLRDVVVNMPAIYTQSHPASVDVDIMGHEVSQKDLFRAAALAQKQAAKEGWSYIHSIAVGYAMDGHKGVESPVGMKARQLSVDLNVILAEEAAMSNIDKCVSRSHLDVEGYCSSVYAAGLSSLIEEEMDLGSIVIDMGGGITSFAIFHRGAMIFADSVPLGGDHVTNDIVQGVNTTRQDAERLKVLYGSAIAASSDDAEMLDIPQIDENGAIVTHHVPRSMLIGIIQPRLEEILEMVRDKLNDSGLLEHSGRRVVLTGGAALMPGMRELVQSVIGYQARLGRPIRVKGLPDSVSGAAFASTAGLLHYSCDRHAEMPHEIAAEAEKLPFFDRLRLWFHQNW